MPLHSSEFQTHEDSLRNAVEQGKVPERVAAAVKELQVLFKEAQKVGLPIAMQDKSTQKVLQVCAGYGASSIALLDTGFNPQNILNVDRDPRTQQEHQRNSRLREIGFQNLLVEDYLLSEESKNFDPDLIIGLWASGEVVTSILDSLLQNEESHAVGLFTLCQLSENYRGQIDYIDDAEIVSGWREDNREKLSESNLQVKLIVIESGVHAITYGVLVYRNQSLVKSTRS